MTQTTTRTATLRRDVFMTPDNGQPVCNTGERVPAGTVVYVGRARRTSRGVTFNVRVPGTLLTQTVHTTTLEF